MTLTDNGLEIEREYTKVVEPEGIGSHIYRPIVVLNYFDRTFDEKVREMREKAREIKETRANRNLRVQYEDLTKAICDVQDMLFASEKGSAEYERHSHNLDVLLRQREIIGNELSKYALGERKKSGTHITFGKKEGNIVRATVKTTTAMKQRVEPVRIVRE